MLRNIRTQRVMSAEVLLIVMYNIVACYVSELFMFITHNYAHDYQLYTCVVNKHVNIILIINI
jgi:hypothetical protein